MRSCILVFYIALFLLPAPAAAQDPDALYRQRVEVARAQQAAAIWDTRLKASSTDFESAWKLARAYYWLGGHDAQAARRTALERGIEAGRAASRLQPMRPEGFFWTAANMGALAESFGLRQGLKYRGDIKAALETVLRIEPGFQRGSAEAALGRWYYKVPGLFGGSKKKSEDYLRQAIARGGGVLAHFYLADTLFEEDQDAAARDALRWVVSAPLDPEFEPEDREFKKLAEERLARK